MQWTDNMKGAALMMASMAGFVLNDTFMKLIGPDIGLYQSILVRGVFTSVLIGTFAAWRGAFRVLPQRKDIRLISIRAVAEIGATFAFLTALFNMPLANVTAVLQVLPLTIALAAAVFLGESIGTRRIGAILLGFAGVLIILRPGTSGFNSYALLALLAVAFVTLRDLSVRRFSAQVSSLLVAFITAVVITIAGGVVALFAGSWTPMTLSDLGVFGLASCSIFVGYYCSVAAMRVGEVPIVSTYRYSVLLWAVLLGWVVFGDIPDLWTFVGMGIIAAAGLFTMLRERTLKTVGTAARPNAPPSI